VVLAKNHDKPILEMSKLNHKILVSNDPLKNFPQTLSMILVFSTC